MVDHTSDELELDEALPPFAVLEAYTVPDLPLDFTDRVMDSLHPATSPTRPVRAPWIVAGVAMACAVAATVALALTPRGEPKVTAPAVASSTPSRAEIVQVAAPLGIATGDLVIDTSPHDAIVRIDGVPIGESTGGSPYVRTNLPVGTHRVEVERDGYLPWHRSIDVPPRALHLKVELRATEPAPPFDPFGPTASSTTDDPPTAPDKPRRPRPPSKPSGTGSPDLKNPFGTSSEDLEDPFGARAPKAPAERPSSSPGMPGMPGMKDPFGGP